MEEDAAARMTCFSDSLPRPSSETGARCDNERPLASRFDSHTTSSALAKRTLDRHAIRKPEWSPINGCYQVSSKSSRSSIRSHHHPASLPENLGRGHFRFWISAANPIAQRG